MGGLVPVLLIILPVPVLASLAVNTSSLNVSIGAASQFPFIWG